VYPILSGGAESNPAARSYRAARFDFTDGCRRTRTLGNFPGISGETNHFSAPGDLPNDFILKLLISVSWKPAWSNG